MKMTEKIDDQKKNQNKWERIHPIGDFKDGAY